MTGRAPHHEPSPQATGNIIPFRDRIPSEVLLRIFHLVAALEPNDVLGLDSIRTKIESERIWRLATNPLATVELDMTTNRSAIRAAVEAGESLTVPEFVVKYKRPDTVRHRRYLPAMAVISHVCTQWRHIALAHSSLWTTIRLLHHGLWPYHFLARSRGRLTNAHNVERLDIYLDLSDAGKLDETLSLLFDSITRVEYLSFAANVPDLDDGEVGPDPKDLMRRVFDHLAIHEAPVLQSITFTLADNEWDAEPADKIEYGDGKSARVDRESEEGASRDNGEDAGGEIGSGAKAGQSNGGEDVWDDVDVHDDDGGTAARLEDLESWETVDPIAIPVDIFKGAPPPLLTTLSVTSPLYISLPSTTFSNITSLSLFDISETVFWNVVNYTPRLEGLYVQFHGRFHVPAASPLTVESLVKDLVFLPRLRDLRVKNARLPSFRRFFNNILRGDCSRIRQFFFDIRAFDLMGSADANRLRRLIGPMHEQDPIDVVAITVYDWGGRFAVRGGPATILDTRLWECPWALVGLPWPIMMEVTTGDDPTTASPWVHRMWPDNLTSPSQLSLCLLAVGCTDLSDDLGRFFPMQWLAIAQRFPEVETLKIDDPFVLILTTLWSESSPSQHESFPCLRTLIITADEIDREWKRYRPPSERLSLMRRALTVMGSSPKRRRLETLVFLQCDPAFDEDDLSAMKELVGAHRVEIVCV